MIILSGTPKILMHPAEPTVLPSAFIALCSVIILHRFASSMWWEHLKKHIPATMSNDDSFDRVVTLKVRASSLGVAAEIKLSCLLLV